MNAAPTPMIRNSCSGLRLPNTKSRIITAYRWLDTMQQKESNQQRLDGLCKSIHGNRMSRVSYHHRKLRPVGRSDVREQITNAEADHRTASESLLLCRKNTGKTRSMINSRKTIRTEYRSHRIGLEQLSWRSSSPQSQRRSKH